MSRSGWSDRQLLSRYSHHPPFQAWHGMPFTLSQMRERELSEGFHKEREGTCVVLKSWYTLARALQVV